MKSGSGLLLAGVLAAGLSLYPQGTNAAPSSGFGNRPNDLDVDASWIAEDQLHVDGSYLALEDPTAAKAVLGHELGPGDYYTYLRLKNELDVHGRNCGRSGSWSFVATATIDYVREPGVTYRLVSAAPLLVVANNFDVSSQQRTAGCTFKALDTYSGPYILYEAPRINYGVFTIDIDTTSNIQPPLITLSKIADLASKIGELWLPGLGAASPILEAATADIDAVRNVPSAINHTYKAAVLPTKGITGSTERQTGTRLTFGSRTNLGANSGQIIAYARKSASLVLDLSNGDVTEETVLRNDLLGMPHNCLTGISGCPNPVTFIESTKSTLQTDAAGDVTDKAIWGKIFGECKHMRTAAKLLHLSPVDQLIVRWAVLVDANLLQSWGSEGFSAAWNPSGETDRDKKIRDAVAKAADIGLFDASECWTDQDNKRLAALQSALQRNFTRSYSTLSLNVDR